LPQIHDQICPWCQTEIVWDPEIGPEEACPHCFNELGDYRIINLEVRPDEEPDGFDEEDDYEDDISMTDEYEEGVQHVLDSQEEAPECPSCRSYMLLAGTQTAPGTFVPYVHQALKQPLLNVSFSVQVYVCPSCFRVEQHLSERDRLTMMELLEQVKA
jgi:Zn finger protein HypA/HybF involved in hydrogenase expression